MCTLMNQIDDVGNEELQRIFREGDSYGVGDKMREVWKTDRKQQIKLFAEDQSRNGKIYIMRSLLQITSIVIVSITA